METKSTRTDKDVTMQCSMGHAYYKAAQYDKAIMAFESALEIDPDSVDALSGKGNALRMKDKYDEALFFLEQALKLDPNHAFSLARKGEILRCKGQHDGALLLLDKALELDPKHRFAFTAKGEFLRLQSQYEQALLFFDEALEIEPSHVYTLTRKGEVLRMKCQYDEALVFLNKALKLDLNDSFALSSKGEILRERKDYDAAIICFDAALTIEPNDSWILDRKYLALKDKGYALGCNQNNDEALDYFDRALEIKPKNILILSYKAVALMQKGENDNAIALCDQILSVDGENLITLKTKGLALRKKSDCDLAIVCWDKVLTIDPKDTSALQYKGEALRLKGQYDAAIQYFNAALALDPQDVYALATKGAALNSKGDYPEAIQCLDAALKIDSNYVFASNSRERAIRLLNQKNMEMDAISLNENIPAVQTIEVSNAYLGVLEQLKKNQIEKLVFSNIQTVNQNPFVRKLPRRNNHSVSCITALTNGKVVMGGDADQPLKFFDPILDAYSESQGNHRAPIRCLATFTNDQVISISTTNYLKLWNTDNLACLKAFKIPGSAVNCMTVLSNRYVVTGSDDGDLNLLDVEGERCLKTLKITGAINCLGVLPSGKVVSVTYPGYLRIWDMEKGLCLKKLKVSDTAIKSLAILSNGLVVCGLKDRIIVCDVEKNVQVYNLAAHKGFVNSLTILPNGWVVSAGADKALKVWDMAAGVCLETLWGHTNPVGQVVALPDGHTVSKGVDPAHNTLRLWNTKPQFLSEAEKSALLTLISKNKSLISLDLSGVLLTNVSETFNTLHRIVSNHPTLISLQLEYALGSLSVDQIKELFISLIKHKKITSFSVRRVFLTNSFIENGKIINQSSAKRPFVVLKESFLAGLYAKGCKHAERGEYVEAIAWQDKAKLLDPAYVWAWPHNNIPNNIPARTNFTPFKASVERYYDNTTFHLGTETRSVRNKLINVSSDGNRSVVKQLCSSLKKIYKLKFLMKEDSAERNRFQEMTVPSDPDSPEEKLIDNLLAGWSTLNNKTLKDHRLVIKCLIKCYQQQWKERCWLELDQKGIDRIMALLTAGMEMITTPDEQAAFLKQLKKIQNSISLNSDPGAAIIPRINQALGYCPELYNKIDALKSRIQTLGKEESQAVITLSDQLPEQPPQKDTDAQNVKPKALQNAKQNQPTQNLAVTLFLAEKAQEFQNWYHPDICQYLLHMSNNWTKCITVLFHDANEGNNTETFKNQLLHLVMLSNKLNKPALFVSKEPGADNHFVCGIVRNRHLLLFNPLGITRHDACYQTLSELKQNTTLTDVWLSSTPLQKHVYEPNGLVSCGPITLEFATHILVNFSPEAFESFWTTHLKTDEPIHHAVSGLIYYGVNLKSLLPPSLQALGNATDETDYQHKVCVIRKEHSHRLATLPSQHAEVLTISDEDYLAKCKEAPSQVVFNYLITDEKVTINNIDEIKEYTLLSQALNLASTDAKSTPKDAANAQKDATTHTQENNPTVHGNNSQPSSPENSTRLKRSPSRERVAIKYQAKKVHETYVHEISDWMISRTHYGLKDKQDNQLQEFRGMIQAAIKSSLTAVAAMSSAEFDINASLWATLADSAVSLSAGFIPTVGPLVSMGWSAASPFSWASKNDQRAIYAKRSSLTPLFDDMDRFIIEFSSLITAYYYAEILNPSHNRTYMERIKDSIASGKGWESVKRFTQECIEECFTGKSNQPVAKIEGYKEQWLDLVGYIISNFLMNLGKLSFEDAQNNVLATKLSGFFTPITSSPLQFNAQSNGLDLVNAYSCIRLSFLAYETERKIRELAELWGYGNEQGEKRYQFIFNKDFQAFMLADREKICVIFRGTATFVNALTDMHTWLTQGIAGSPDIKVHTGFMNSLEDNWDKIKAFIQGYYQEAQAQGGQPHIWFTGHSLGGALATLAAFRYFNEERQIIPADHIHLYTYGQPKCGNQAFAEYMNQHIHDYQRFVNYLDPFTKVPYKKMGYAHCGQLRWIDPKAKKLHNRAEYKAYKLKKDDYGKEKLRGNSINRLPDHSDYLQKIGKIAAKAGVKVYDFAKYINYEFEISGPPLSDVMPEKLKALEERLKVAEQNTEQARKEAADAREKADKLEEQVKITNEAMGNLQTELQEEKNKNGALEGKVTKLERALSEQDRRLANIEQHMRNDAAVVSETDEAESSVPAIHLVEKTVDGKFSSEDKPANDLSIETEIVLPVENSAEQVREQRAGGNSYLPVLSKPKKTQDSVHMSVPDTDARPMKILSEENIDLGLQ